MFHREKIRVSIYSFALRRNFLSHSHHSPTGRFFLVLLFPVSVCARYYQKSLLISDLFPPFIPPVPFRSLEAFGISYKHVSMVRLDVLV